MISTTLRNKKEAQAILTDGLEHDNVVLSVQVLGEFFNVVTRHINPMSVDEVRSIIAALSILPVQEIDLPMVKRASILTKLTGFHTGIP